MRRLLRRTARFIGKNLLAIVVLSLALVLSTVLHLQLPLARRVIAAWLGSAASGEITGTLTIGAIDSLDPRALEFRNVTVYDPKGRRVIGAERLTIVPELDPAVLRGAPIRIRSARLDGAEAILIDDGSGLPSLIESFDAAVPGAPGSEPTRVIVDGIEVRGLRLRGDLLGLEGLDARDVHARGRLTIEDEVRVQLDQASGDVVAPFDFPGRVESLRGTISTAPNEGVELEARATREGATGLEVADAHISLKRPPGPEDTADELDLRVKVHEIRSETLVGLGYDWMPKLDMPLSGDFRLHGPFENLTIEADLQSEAGPVRVEGAISERDGVRVAIASPALKLKRALPDMPNLEVEGAFEIQTRPDDQPPEFKATLAPMLYKRLRLPAITIEGVIGDDGVEVKRLRGSPAGGNVRVDGNIAEDGSLSVRVRGRIARIEREPNLARLLPGARASLEADVRVSSKNYLRGRLDFRGRIVLRDVEYGVLRAKRLTLEGSARGDPERPALDLDVDGRQVYLGPYAMGDAALTLKGGPKNYKAGGQFIQAGRRTFNLEANIAAEPTGFSIDADPIEVVVGDGTWRGSLRGLRVVGKDAVELDLLRLANRSQRLELGGRLYADGEDSVQAQLQDFDLKVVRALWGESFPLREGRADTMLQLSGNIEDPELLVQGALRQGAISTIEDVNALYMLTYREGAMELDGEVDLGERGVLRVAGRGQVDRSLEDPLLALQEAEYDLELSTDGLALSMIPQFREAEIEGAIDGQLHLGGTRHKPRIDGQLSLAPIAIPGWGELTIVADIIQDEHELRANLAIGDDGGALAIVSGSLPLDLAAALEDFSIAEEQLRKGPWSFSGQTLRRRLDRMPGTVPLLVPYPIEVATHFELSKQDGISTGFVRFFAALEQADIGHGCGRDSSVKLEGTLDLQQARTELLAALALADNQVATIEGTVDTPIDRWLEGEAVEMPDRFRASARIELERLQDVPYLCELGSGQLRGELEVDGGRGAEPLLVFAANSRFVPRVQRTPGAGRGFGITERDRRTVKSCRSDPIRMRIRVDADRERMKFGAGLSGCHGGDGRLKGTAELDWGPLAVLPTLQPDSQIEADLTLDDSELKPLLDRIPGIIDARARAHGKVHLAGPLERVRAEGKVHVHDGQLYMLATGQRLEQLEARVDFRGNWAKVEHLHARAGDGHLNSAGGLGFDGLWPRRARMAVSMKQLPIQREGADLAWMTGSAAVDADIEPERTRAVVKIHDLAVDLPDASKRTLQPLEAHPDIHIVSDKLPELIEPYPVELMLDGRNLIHVERNDFDVWVRTELAVKYINPNLHVGGYVLFEHGEFEVMGKRFVVQHGRLRFDGGTDWNPEVNLTAVHEPLLAGASPITVNVGGTLLEPEVHFTTDACPGDSGGAMYLVAGRCVTDDPMAQQQADEAADALVTGVAGMAGGVLTLISREGLGEAAPQIGIERRGDRSATRIKAGMYSSALVPKFMRSLVERVYLEGAYTRGDQPDDDGTDQIAGEETSNRLDFLIELYFPHNIVGSGKFGQNNWGLDVTWEP
ncbi:MAG: translocation/assembly module TamB domain-containing protein [Myxococcales bacterium]|nr:translocation/assembly module TamB domain-containing protein [Myxococcales bacterium]